MDATHETLSIFLFENVLAYNDLKCCSGDSGVRLCSGVQIPFAHLVCSYEFNDPGIYLSKNSQKPTIYICMNFIKPAVIISV